MTALTKKHRRGGLLLAGMLVLGAVGTGTAAHAAVIDPNQTGSIIIHKYENPGNGTQNPEGTGGNPTTPPVEGVTFEYCLIDGIDITDGTNTGWDALNAITAAQKTAAQTGSTLGSYTLSGCQSVTTDATGTATAANLPVGPYFVRETAAPPKVIDKAAPFIVTVPTPKDGTTLDGDWVYDVNVYPKNTVVSGPAKNIVNQPTNGAALGAPITYQVTTKVPGLPAGQTYDKFIVNDTLDTKLDAITAASTIKVSNVSATGTKTDLLPADYVAAWVDDDNGTPADTTDDHWKLSVTLTASGRAKLVAGQNLVVEFQATANATGTIDNQAFVNLNDLVLTPGQPNGPGGEGSPTNIVTTRWGGLVVRKVNGANTADALAGAEFEVYMGTTDAAGCKADIATLPVVTEPGGTDPLTVTSSTDGTVVFPGLWVGDTELVTDVDGTVTNVSAAGHDFTQRCYVLKETKAPAGFVLPTGAAALTEVLVQAGDNGTVTVPALDIENDQQVAPELPFTGASGIMTLTGLGLVAVAAGGVLVTRRRNQAAA